jgi:hypothetical protein
MNIEKTIRILARSSYWQNIYKSAKEVPNFSFFENKENLSAIQSSFLFWLRLYASLYEDYFNEESPILTEEVINNDYRCDAYIYYRNKLYKQKIQKNKVESESNKLAKNKKHTAKPTPFAVEIQR